MSNVEFDKQFGNLIIGIDEAGRGPLCGPVVAAAVIMPLDNPIEGVKDSKKLSEKQREKLFYLIKNRAHSLQVTVINNDIIDKINILQATFLAMEQSFRKIKHNYDAVLIDGNRTFIKSPKFIPIVKGDDKSYSIACASIVAKVVRDKIMYHYAKKFPIYQWDKNKGYPTKLHRELIKKYGVTKYHRKSFLKNIINNELFDEVTE
jgi:ribonuclease HII